MMTEFSFLFKGEMCDFCTTSDCTTRLLTVIDCIKRVHFSVILPSVAWTAGLCSSEAKIIKQNISDIAVPYKPNGYYKTNGN